MKLQKKLWKKLGLTGLAMAAFGTAAVSANVLVSETGQSGTVSAVATQQVAAKAVTVPTVTVGMKEVVDKVAAAYPTAQITEIKLATHSHEGEMVHYDVEVVDNGVERELDVDATTGAVTEDTQGHGHHKGHKGHDHDDDDHDDQNDHHGGHGQKGKQAGEMQASQDADATKQAPAQTPQTAPAQPTAPSGK